MHLRRPTRVTTQDGIGRIVPVHSKSDEANRCKAPVALTVLVQPQMTHLPTGAAAQAEELLSRFRHGVESKHLRVWNVLAAQFDPDQRCAMTLLRFSR